MKKKLLIYMYNLAGGGAERTIVNIINNINKSEFEVVLVIGSNNKNDYLYLVNNDIKLIFLHSEKRRQIIFKLNKIIKKEKPDLLFSTLNTNNIVLLLAKLFSFKKIPTIVREANNRTQSGSVTIKNKIITSLLYNLCSHIIISLSKGVQDDLIKNFKIKENRIEVIYNPVDITNINLLKDEVVSDLDFIKDEKLIVAVGKLGEQKDYPTLLKAFEIVQREYHTNLLIIGKGADEYKLKGLCKELRIEKKVHFMGFKDNPYKYMKKADVFVLTSKWEGFGHVIVEAMTVGTPVVATNCNSGPGEIIDKNKYGVLVPVEDHKTIAEKIIELLNDEKRREHFTKAGLRRSNIFDVKNIVKQYEDVFLSLIKKQ
ncbi:glycosyltransferase [Mesobacillus maritimus]|uniref:glycosyltransferase n=1 Tax=Mesobacillus maritimus TaxID=1643336 RepID=UPI00384E8AEA